MRKFHKSWSTKHFYEQTFWYNFYNINQSVVLGSKPGGKVETHEPQTRRLSSNSSVDSLSLNFPVYFGQMLNYFSIKTNKRKVRKCLKCVMEVSRRFDLANGKYLPNFLGVFARIVKVKHERA